MKMDTAKEFAIEIHKNANKEHLELSCESFKTTVFDVLERGDITSIEFELEEQYVEDGKIPRKEYYDYYVDWCGESDYINEAQKSYISKPGHLYLVIDKNSKIDDYFDKEEIDNDETMEFQFDMYDVGNEKDDDEDIQSIDCLLCEIGKLPAFENEENLIVSVDTFCEPAICKEKVYISNTTGRKCPHCGESYYTELYSDSTAVYYPPIYKNGVNINPDRNQITTTCRCLNCGKEFTY